MSFFPKLEAVGAIYREPQGVFVHCGLEIPESLVQRGQSQVSFVSKIFESIIVHHQEIPFPNEVASSLGRSSVSFDEYFETLRKSGYDVDDLRQIWNDAEATFRATVGSRKTKADAFFNLIQSSWIVREKDVRTYIDEESIYDLLEVVLEHSDLMRARLKAIRRHAADPKQSDKTLIRQFWDDWQKRPDRYKGKAAFARDMLDKFPNLKSQPVIEGWCRAWEREA